MSTTPLTSTSTSPFDLDETQRSAVEMVMTSHFCVITGGPGTGKTKTLRAVVERLAQENTAVSIVGPTAKSCAMISRSLGANANVRPFTIHKIINDVAKINRMRGTCVIVDECSMVSLELMCALLFEFWNGSYLEIDRLVLVGDPDQFDPVSGTRMFRDLINWAKVPQVRFTKSYRFTGGALAQNIETLRCANEIDPARFAVDESFVFVEKENNDDAYVGHVREMFEEIAQYTPSIQVLCLTGKMREKLNVAVQSVLNGKSPVFKFNVRVNDPIVCIRNYYQGDDLVVNNGAMGFARIENGKRVLVYETFDETGTPKQFKDVETRNRFCTRFALNYARTVHSAQGDEADQIIAVLDIHNFPSADRSAPYTAVTRAKQKCVLFANRDHFKHVTSKRPIVETDFLNRLKSIR